MSAERNPDLKLHVHISFLDGDGKEFDFLSKVVSSFHEASSLIQERLLIRPYVLDDVVEKVKIEMEWK